MLTVCVISTQPWLISRQNVCCHLDQETIANSVVGATNCLVLQTELICAYFYLNMQGLNREANLAILYAFLKKILAVQMVT